MLLFFYHILLFHEEVLDGLSLFLSQIRGRGRPIGSVQDAVGFLVTLLGTAVS